MGKPGRNLERPVKRYDVTAGGDADADRYDRYLPLHGLWLGYARELLSTERGTAAANMALKLDWHGAKVQVVRAKNPALVGITGIVLQEYAGVVKVVTPEDRILTIPKRGVVFTMQVDDTLVHVYGTHTVMKSVARTDRQKPIRYHGPLRL